MSRRSWLNCPALDLEPHLFWQHAGDRGRAAWTHHKANNSKPLCESSDGGDPHARCRQQQGERQSRVHLRGSSKAAGFVEHGGGNRHRGTHQIPRPFLPD